MTRNKMIYKIILVCLAVFVMVSILSGCGRTPEIITKKLKVWVFSEDYADALGHAFAADHPSADFAPEFILVDVAGLPKRLSEAEETGDGLPDVIMLSPDILPRMLESGALAELAALGLTPERDRYFHYTYDMGLDGVGVLRAAPWQANPCMFFYRRSMARVYLGSDDPDIIAPMLADWDGFYTAALTISQESDGKTRMTAGLDDLLRPQLASGGFCWLREDGSLNMTPEVVSLFDIAASLVSQRLVWQAEQWSEAWVAGMSDPASVFGYFLSPIELRYVLKRAAGGTTAGEGSFGDWAAAPGPAARNQGGVWLAAYSGTKLPQEAGIFIGYFTSEREAMRKYSLQTGQFSSDVNVSEQIKFDPQFSEPILAGQNYYPVAVESAVRITARKATRYDSSLDIAFCEEAAAYATGQKTLEQAAADFRATAEGIINS